MGVVVGVAVVGVAVVVAVVVLITKTCWNREKEDVENNAEEVDRELETTVSPLMNYNGKNDIKLL